MADTTVPIATPAPSSFGAWVAASRPATLSAAIVPVVVGTACAHVSGGIRWSTALAAMFGAICIQIGTNFANDVFDFEKGADTDERLGPTRAVAAGLLTPGQMRLGMFIAFGLAVLAGIHLIAVGGWPIVAIGVASILSGIAYTGGPWPLGYNGLGDVFVMLFFGFIAVCATAYVQVDHVPQVAWLAAIPVGAIATAIIVVNNLRDRHTDALVGKRTLAVRLGRKGVLIEYAVLFALAELVPVLMAWQLGSWWLLLPLVTTPMAIGLVRKVAATEGRALNPLLGATAKLLLIHGVLLSIGLFAS